MAKSKTSTMQNFGVKNPAVITDGCKEAKKRSIRGEARDKSIGDRWVLG